MTTNDSMALRALLEKTDDPTDCEMVAFAASRLMDLEVAGLCGAGFHEKSPDSNSRDRQRKQVHQQFTGQAA